MEQLEKLKFEVNAVITALEILASDRELPALDRRLIDKLLDARTTALVSANRLKLALRKYAKNELHLEPSDLHDLPAEKCVDCRAPTRHWIGDGDTPICPACWNNSSTKISLA